MAITADSKHKDAAYKVLATLLSDEIQTLMAQNGMLPVLQNENVRQQFGKNLSYLQGKNLQAIFKTTPAAKKPPTLFDNIASEFIDGEPVGRSLNVMGMEGFQNAVS
jgi:multiple sugar transport system substrate-binding protein